MEDSVAVVTQEFNFVVRQRDNCPLPGFPKELRKVVPFNLPFWPGLHATEILSLYRATGPYDFAKLRPFLT